LFIADARQTKGPVVEARDRTVSIHIRNKVHVVPEARSFLLETSGRHTLVILSRAKDLIARRLKVLPLRTAMRSFAVLRTTRPRTPVQQAALQHRRITRDLPLQPKSVS